MKLNLLNKFESFEIPSFLIHYLQNLKSKKENSFNYFNSI